MAVKALKLNDRAIIKLTGMDTKDLLQGLITNDIRQLNPTHPIYAALLTPQGKYLADFIVYESDGAVMLDCEKSYASDLIRRLTMYRMRADVTLEDISDEVSVWALWGSDDVTLDPRDEQLGGRVILASPPEAESLEAQEYEEKRVSCGVPGGSLDLIRDKYFWLECGAERLGGVDFNKGCYIGQEQTARMKHRATLKKGIVSVLIEGSAQSGDPIINGAGQKIGMLHTIAGPYALAFLRFEKADGKLQAGSATITLS